MVSNVWTGVVSRVLVFTTVNAGRELDPFMGVARPRARFMNLFTFQRKNETEKPDGKSIQETDGFLKTNQ